MQSFEALNEIWQAVYATLGNFFSQSTVELWFKDMRLIYLGDDIALLTILQSFKKKFIENQYIDILKDSFSSVLGFEVEPLILTDTNVKTFEEAEALYKKHSAEKQKNDIIEKQKNLDDSIHV